MTLCPKSDTCVSKDQLTTLASCCSQLNNYLEMIKAHLVLSNTVSARCNFSAIEEELVKSSQVIFCTLSVSGRQMLHEVFEKNGLTIDVLIIDEAAQAVEAETLIPFHYRPKKCLLVGDTKQLPATVLSVEATNRNFHWSMMWRLLEECRQPFLMLDTQYRMHPEIRT